jgi:hypothetical protein
MDERGCEAGMVDLIKKYDVLAAGGGNAASCGAIVWRRTGACKSFEPEGGNVE